MIKFKVQKRKWHVYINKQTTIKRRQKGTKEGYLIIFDTKYLRLILTKISY
jgi:hypothetical protein